MIAFGKTDKTCGEKSYCAYAGRRDGKEFVYSEQDIVDKYSANIKTIGRTPDVLSGAMGNVMYIASFNTKEEMNEFYSDVLKTK